MKKNLKKNYFLLSVLFVVTILLTLFVNNVIRNYKYLKVNVSPMSSVVSSISINELDLAVLELNEVIIYVGNDNNKEVRKLERELIKKIKSDNLENYVYYCDVSNELKDNKYINDLIKEIPELSNKLYLSPALIYFKNGKVIEVIDSRKSLITVNDLNYLVDKYNIGK